MRLSLEEMECLSHPLILLIHELNFQDSTKIKTAQQLASPRENREARSHFRKIE